MILWILGISVILFYLSFIMLKKGIIRSFLVIIFCGTTLGSLLLITINDNDHFGMEKSTKVETKTIRSASPNKNLPLLLYQNIGTSGKHQVYIYKDTLNKNKHTKADYETTNKVDYNKVGNAKLVSIKHYWVYKNDFYNLLFGEYNKKQFISETNEFKIPNNWTVLSTTQAKALEKKLSALKKPNPDQKAQLAAQVQQKMKEALIKDPTMSTSQKANLAKQSQTEVQAELIQKAVKEVKNTVK